MRYPERDITDKFYGHRISVQESAESAGHYLANIRCETQRHKEGEIPCATCRLWAAKQLTPLVERALQAG